MSLRARELIGGTKEDPVDWLALAGTALELAKAIHKYGWGDAAEEAEKRRQLEAIRGGVRTSTSIILDAVITTEINRVTGDVNGFLDIFDAYDANPDSQSEEDRLREIADESASTMANLAANITVLPVPGSTSMEAEDEKSKKILALESAS